MNTDASKSLMLDNLCDVLFDYSIDRKDMNFVLSALPDSVNNKRNLLEYELQILKIISVGWATSFFMFNKHGKNVLVKTFWEKIRDFSTELSYTLMLACKENVNYFDILKLRTNMYVNYVGSKDPLIIIGPKFAKICNLKDNPHVILAASKLFKLTIDNVKQYLDPI